MCKFADFVLGKKSRNIANNISSNALCFYVKRRALYKKYLCDLSSKNKRNAKKVDKELTYVIKMVPSGGHG